MMKLIALMTFALVANASICLAVGPGGQAGNGSGNRGHSVVMGGHELNRPMGAEGNRVQGGAIGAIGTSGAAGN